MKFIVNVHSFVDIVTNSSTELFVLDIDKSLDLIEEIIKEKEKEFPCEYGYTISVYKGDPYSYCYIDNPINDLEETLKYLRLKGYKIEEPETEKEIEAIIIECERGCMDKRMIKFIEETFNTEVIDY